MVPMQGGAPLPAVQGEDEEEDDIDLRHHLSLLRRRMWVIVLCFVVVFTLVAVMTFRATPVYEATAKLLIERRVPQMAALGQVGERRDEKYYTTQIRLITSKAVLQKALERSDVQEVFEKQEEAPPEGGLVSSIRRELAHVFGSENVRDAEHWERLQERVSVSPVRESDLVKVSVRSRSPRQAQLLANSVSQAYVAYTISREKQNAGEVFELLQKQMKEQEETLQEAEDRLIDYREKTNVAELNTNASNPDMDRWRKLSEEHTAVQVRRIELSVATNDIAQRRRQGAGPMELLSVTKVRNDPAVLDLVEAREKVRMERSTALRIHGERHPSVIELSDQLAYVESRLRDAIERVADSVQAEHEMLLAREKELRSALDREDQAALERARKAQVYQRLERDTKRQTRVFEVIVDRMREVDLIKDEGMTNVSLIETAVLPRSPVSPKKRRNLLLGGFLGLMLGVAMAYGLSFMDDTIKTPEDIEEGLGVPWLGYVPKMSRSNGIVPAQQMLHEPGGNYADVFRTVRTNIYFSGQRGQIKSLMVTSCAPGEGKTVFSSNLAAAVAHDQKKVLLVDADLRRPRLHKANDLERVPGLTNILVEGRSLEEVVQSPGNGQSTLENLHVVPAGSKTPNPAELLGNERMARFMQEVRERYDMVIYDSCPAMFLADNAALASASDGVALVVHAGQTKKSAAQRAHKQLLMVDGNVLGVVLNKVKEGYMKHYGSYGGYYYSYDYYYDDEDVEEIGSGRPDSAALPGPASES
jgi:capsular exopolysaccharide synthesis family protein